MRSWVLKVLSLALALPTAGRRYHDDRKHRHAHTFLQLCTDGSTTESQACVEKVDNKWPQPAVLATHCMAPASGSDFSSVIDPSGECDAAGHVTGGTRPSTHVIFAPITVPLGIRTPPTDYKAGADVDTLTSWDRVSCRPKDVLVATGWHRSYTPQECARLCSKVKDFGGKWCTHFSRQWAHSDVEEHSDMCGRDGDPMMAHHPVMELSASWRGPRAGPRSVARAETGTWTAAGVGAGEYSYPAQCIFYYSENDDCCATKKGWTTANPHVAGASSSHCADRFGAMSDHWNTKHRTWKVVHKPATWPPAANPAWPTKGIVPRTLSYTVTWSMVFASNADVETDDRRRRLDGSLFARLFARRRLDGSKNAALRRKLAAALHVSADAITIRATDTAVGEHTGATVVFTIRLEGRRKAIAARRKITRQYGSKAKAASLLGATLASVDAPTRTANYPPPPPAPPPPNSSPLSPPSPPPPSLPPAPAGPPPLPAGPWTLYTSRNDLHYAVNAWVADEATATETHGHISGWDTSRVNTFAWIFDGKINFNGEIGGWDTSKVTSMENTFNRAYAFNKPLDWDTSKVTTLKKTFNDALAFDQQLSWDTSSVTFMWETFEAKHNVPSHHNVFNQPLAWDTSKVTTMHAVFKECNQFNQPLAWDTSSVTKMNFLFSCHACHSPFNQPLTWDTSKVTSMHGAFWYASDFDQAVHGWDVTSVTDFALMFDATAMINDDCKRQLTYASFSQQSAAFDLAYPSWSSAVCPS